MKFFRYPELTTPDLLLKMWSELIRVLDQRDSTPIEINEIFGNIVQNDQTVYQTQKTDGVIIHDTTAGIITQYLPKAKEGKNQILTVKNLTGVNAVVIEPNTGELIDNAANLSISTVEQRTIRSDGFNWWVIYD